MIDLYNRYVPQPDGSYRRDRIQPPKGGEPHPSNPQPPHPPCATQPPCEPPPPPRPDHIPPSCQGSSAGSFLQQLLPKDLDTGDLLIIVLLLLMAGDCRDDRNTALLTLALYLFM